MKIAIIGKFDFHLECAAFILEMYNNNNNIDIYITPGTNKFNHIEYYSTIFNFNVIYNDFNKNILHNYDKIFKLTSNDNLGDLTPEEIKLLLIKLDMPIRDSEGAIKYQAGHNSAGEILGLSPLDIFLHNNKIINNGITDAQLEALL